MILKNFVTDKKDVAVATSDLISKILMKQQNKKFEDITVSTLMNLIVDHKKSYRFT